jgi:hypothetical protein
MLRTITAMLWSAVLAGVAPLGAAEPEFRFADLQSACVPTGGIHFGPGSRWPECQITKGRWFSTIGHLDLYQAQYCLGSDAGCTRRALVIYVNRAYTAGARVLLQRNDPGGAEYDDPLVVASSAGTYMMLKVRIPRGEEQRHYYRWQGEGWRAVDARRWLRQLGRHLPPGTAPAAGIWPDLDTMSARVPLARRGDAPCCPGGGIAEVSLGLTPRAFTVKAVHIDSRAQ